MTFFMHRAAGSQSTAGSWSFNLVTSGAITEAAAETAWAAAIVAFFTNATIGGYFSTGTILTSTSTSTASPTFKQTTKTTTPHTTAGTASGTMLPEFCSICISLVSGSATRYGHGRMYLPSPASSTLATGSSGHISSTVTGTIATQMGVCFASLGTAGLTPVLVTRQATAGGPAQYSTRNILTGSVARFYRVQKRRGGKLIAGRDTFVA